MGVKIQITLVEKQVRELDRLLAEDGEYENRGEFIRHIIRDYLLGRERKSNSRKSQSRGDAGGVEQVRSTAEELEDS